MTEAIANNPDNMPANQEQVPRHEQHNEPPHKEKKVPKWVLPVVIAALVLLAVCLFAWACNTRSPSGDQLIGAGQAGVQPTLSIPPNFGAGQAEVKPTLSTTKNVLVTFGHRCRIFNQEGELLTQRYVADELACANFEANFRAKISDSGSVKSIQAFVDKTKP